MPLVIYIDSRAGSGELEKYFQPYGIVVQKTKLDFGDFEFEGLGPRGRSAVVFERKAIEDLVQSMESKRLSGHQLPGMAAQYDYAYLVIEGIWRSGPDGELEINRMGQWWNTKVATRGIVNFIMGLAFRAGVMPWRTQSQRETVAFIVDQYRMWTDKHWAEHTAHDAVYAPAEGAAGFGLSLNPRQITVAEKVALQLPGLDSKARYVAQHFGSVRAMANASREEWSEVKWKTKLGKDRYIGTETAHKIVESIVEGSHESNGTADQLPGDSVQRSPVRPARTKRLAKRQVQPAHQVSG